jgi:hypothetical protein
LREREIDREREFITSDSVQTQNYEELSTTALAQKFTLDHVGGCPVLVIILKVLLKIPP